MIFQANTVQIPRWAYNALARGDARSELFAAICLATLADTEEEAFKLGAASFGMEFPESVMRHALTCLEEGRVVSAKPSGSNPVVVKQQQTIHADTESKSSANNDTEGLGVYLQQRINDDLSRPQNLHPKAVEEILGLAGNDEAVIDALFTIMLNSEKQGKPIVSSGGFMKTLLRNNTPQQLLAQAGAANKPKTPGETVLQKIAAKHNLKPGPDLTALREEEELFGDAASGAAH